MDNVDGVGDGGDGSGSDDGCGSGGNWATYGVSFVNILDMSNIWEKIDAVMLRPCWIFFSGRAERCLRLTGLRLQMIWTWMQWV